MMKCLLSALLAVAVATQGPAGAFAKEAPAKKANHQASAPKLVVLVAVDQMRGDYPEWYGKNWKGGLRRLLDGGAWFQNAAYPYLSTITCPGHATLGTGAYPHRHGMIMNTWYDRASKKVIECTFDPDATLIPHGVPNGAHPHLGAGDSAKNLMAPTLGDEMQAQLPTKPRVVGVSWKARASIDVSGHKPDTVLWFESGTWVTSNAFASAPIPWVEEFVKENPIKIGPDTVWNKLMPAASYKYDDEAVGEAAPRPWSRSFPHPLQPATSAPGSYGLFGTSPAADDYVGRLAEGAVKGMKLGRGEGADFLGVSFSMTDLVGHAFGPRSHEVQDVLARLDGVLGRLLDTLDREVGRGNYVVALSADHGVAVVPEQLKAEGKDAGRISANALRQAANGAIEAELGKAEPVQAEPGRSAPRSGWVVEIQYNDLYLRPGAYDALAKKPGAVGRVLASLRQVPGVADALDGNELKDPAQAPDGLKRAAALSYFPGRSGELVVAPKENWVMGGVNGGTTHGSTNFYDQHVPVVLYGAGIKPGKYARRVSPADIVPTLGQLVGVKLEKAEGKPLIEALAKGEAPVKARRPASARAQAR